MYSILRYEKLKTLNKIYLEVKGEIKALKIKAVKKSICLARVYASTSDKTLCKIPTIHPNSDRKTIKLY
jgi:hypothetical protein